MYLEEFLNTLKCLDFKDTFNPYVNTCPMHDVADAPAMRVNMLNDILNAAVQHNAVSLWIGRDLGYRGGRRTGLALTDDMHLSAHLARWNLESEQPTKDRLYVGRTATVIWQVLDKIQCPIFLWNVFPLHPHEPDNPFSNRSHNAIERRAGEELLSCLIQLLDPRRMVAIGNDAELTARKFRQKRREVIKVRHPSYGGQSEFLVQMEKLYSI